MADAPTTPGSWVGQSQNGYFWNGTSWDQGETVPSTPTAAPFGGAIIRQQQAATPSATPAAPQAPSVAVQAGPAAFVNKYRAAAEKISAETGVPVARILAQAGFESGWNVNPPGNNFFGVKAGSNYQGQSQTLDTKEADASGNLVPTKGSFRVYKTPEESFADWANVMKQGNFSGALDPKLNDAQYAMALQKGGYGTDPAYASKLHGTINTARAALGQDPDGSAVASSQAPAPTPAAQPYVPPPGLLSATATSASQDAGAAAAQPAQAKQQAAYADLMKSGTGLLGQATTNAPAFMSADAGGDIHRPQAQPVALPDFLQILAQQRLKQGA